MNVLHVVPHAGYSGTCKQLALLAAHSRQENFTKNVCVLGRNGPMGDVLRSSGIAVDVLGWTRAFDVTPLLHLREIVRNRRPDVIHAWGFASLRASVFVGGKARFVFTAPPFPYARRISISPLDRWLLRRPDEVLAGDRYSTGKYAEMLGTNHRVRHLAPSADFAHRGVDRHALCRMARVPENSRFIVCVGPLTRYKGFRDAIWALDILKCVYDDLFLVLIGDGPDRRRLEEFARAIRVTDRVRFVGEQSDVFPWLAAAEIVWVPSESPGGTNVALEAMAAGRPVVASRVPGLVDIVVDGVTGFLFTPGDKVGLARQTHALLRKQELQASLGEAARRRVVEHFRVSSVIDGYADVYQRLAA